MSAHKRIFGSRSAVGPGPQQVRHGAMVDIAAGCRRPCTLRARRARAPMILCWLAVELVAALFASTAPAKNPLTNYAASTPYLGMPHDAAGKMPKLLSQTGAFKNIRTFEPADSLIPYDLAVPFWSDGASKTRWMSLPKEKIEFATEIEWRFPSGTVFVKTFELPINDQDPAEKRRLETRLIVRDSADGVYGVTYKWRDDNSDADLLETNLTEAVLIRTPAGTRTQMWYYPSPSDCLTCHTHLNGGVLGPKTRQLNCDFTYSPGSTENQLRAWNRLGLFDTRLDDSDFANLPSLAGPNDKSRSIEDRARSYLDANCAHCHRPGGTVAYFDARYDVPLPEQHLINGQVLIDERIDNARTIAPNDIWRSILYLRVNTIEAFKMPPLAHNVIDQSGLKLVREWIESLPGPPVLPPPEILPSGGKFNGAVKITINSEPGAEVHYTLDGTVPTKSDPLYKTPIEIELPSIVRAKAFKRGFTKSITSQQLYVLGK